MPRPRLKTMTCVVRDDLVVASLDPRHRVELADPQGHVRRLLTLLAEGSRTPAELAAALGVPDAEVADALRALDGMRWLDDADAENTFDEARRERFYSNLAFLRGFSDLSRSAESMQQRLARAHVLVLGVGGLGSAVVQHLVGLGVGRLTLLDFDVVAVRNFARQFTYTPAAVGLSKVEQVAAWVAAFDPAVAVRPVHARVTGPDDVAALLDGVDLVVSAIDQPDEVDQWVNRACVPAGVPFIRGGLAHLQGLYWSVEPGRSACRECLETHRRQEVEAAGGEHVVTWPSLLRAERVNRAIGPVAGLLGGLVGMEALRYLTRFTEPVSGGTYHLVDFTGACHITTDAWPRDPDCPICAKAPTEGAVTATSPTEAS